MIIAALCSECKASVGLIASEHNVTLAVYPDGGRMFLFECPKCKQRSQRRTEPSTFYSASVVEIAQRFDIPVISMPDREMPVECDFAPFELDDLIDYMLGLDTMIEKLLELG